MRVCILSMAVDEKGQGLNRNVHCVTTAVIGSIFGWELNSFSAFLHVWGNWGF